MSLVDILVWAVLLAFAVKGFMKGLVREVCSLLGLAVGAWAAFTYHAAVGAMLGRLIHLPPRVTSVLAFLVTLVVLGLVFFLIGHLLTVILKIALLGGVNRVGGTIFGLLQGALLLCFILYIGSTPPVPAGVRDRLTASGMARVLRDCGREIVVGWKGSGDRPVRIPQVKDVDDSRR